MSMQRPIDIRRRSSSKRLAVDEVMRESDAFRSAQGIHHLLRSRGQGVGLATVYRNLQAMVDAEEVDTLRNEEGSCSTAGALRGTTTTWSAAPADALSRSRGRAVERWAARVAEEHGFVDVEHTVEIFGTCVSCRA